MISKQSEGWGGGVIDFVFESARSRERGGGGGGGGGRCLSLK